MTGDGKRRSVGRDAGRPDAREKVRGTARYGTDLRRADALEAGVIRSQHPHGEVTAVDTEAAEAVDGVGAVITRMDLPGGFDERVRHYGDVVAAVAAHSREAVERGLEAIEYEIEPLEAVHDPTESVRDGAAVVQDEPAFGQPDRHPVSVDNPEYVQNVDDYHSLTVGDAEAALAEADHVHTATYRTPRVTHCNLERHCCIAEWDGDTLELTETIGNRGNAENTLERLFGDCTVEITQPPHSGSSFGGRSLAKMSLEPVAATLARDADQPVRLAFDREAEFTAAEARHPCVIELSAGATADGQLSGLTVDVVADTGPYPNGVGHIVLSACQGRPLDLYRVQNYRYEGVSAFTNNTPTGEYRGIGVTQITWALESHLDELARNAGFDPVAFKRRNWVAEGYDRPQAGPVTSCGLEDCLERGRSTFEALTDDAVETRFVGHGMAAGGQITTPAVGKNDDYAEARLVLHPDGSLTVRTGSIDVGQGSTTVLGQIAAEATGVPLSQVTVGGYDPGDPVEDKYGSIANRTTFLIGKAITIAAANLLTAVRDHIADAVALPEGPLTLEEGSVETTDGDSIPLSELLEEAIIATGRAEATEAPIGYGVHFAEVAVDPGTGAVDVRTYVAAQDVGFAINPTLVEGQLEGAVQHGIEFATLSELLLSRGVPENASLASYPVSTPVEMPDTMATEIIESNEQSGPYGAKGVGTPSQPPVAPAITNAIRDAVGTRFTEAPVRAEDVFFALREDQR